MNMMTVADAAEFIRGITFKPHELIDLDDPDAIVCMRTKNIQADLDERDLIAVPSRLVRQEQKLLRAGDILISSANSWELVGKCSFVPELSYRATAGGFIAIVRPKSRTHPRFLYHWLNSPATQHVIRNMGRQTTNISNLDVNRFKEIELPAYEYDEQRRIAAILDKADAIRRKREQALTLADHFLRSVFLEMFGDLNENPHQWQSLPLVKVLATDPQNGLYRHSSDYGTGTQILRIDGFYDGYLLGSETFKRLRIDQVTKEKYLLRENDIVINRVNSPEYLGKCALISGLVEDTVFESNMMRFSVDPMKVNPRFLVDQLRSEYMKRQIATSAKPAVNQSSINQTDVKSFTIRLPPIDLQNRYAEIVGAKDRADAKLRVAFRTAKDLLSSLSQHAFAGDL